MLVLRRITRIIRLSSKSSPNGIKDAMGIIAQIYKDIAAIQDMIDGLSKNTTAIMQTCTTISATNQKTTKKIEFTGKEKMAALEDARNEQYAEITRLEAIIHSGIIPQSYTSVITGTTYHATPEELKKNATLPAGIHSFFPLKVSRKQKITPLAHMDLQYANTHTAVQFFIQHKTDGVYPSGGTASKVKQGFLSLDNQTPTYALKVFKKNLFNGNHTHELRIAMRAAFCSRLLGRTGFAFRRKEKQYYLTDWLPGTPLSQVKKETIIAIPVHKRIQFALILIRELAILHQHGICHNDIAPANVMLDDNGLHLFDFDAVRLPEEIIANNAPMIFSTRFMNAQANFNIKNQTTSLYKLFNKTSDIYGLFLTLPFLFPEIVSPSAEKITVPINGDTTNTFIFDGIQLRYGDQIKDYPALGTFLTTFANNNGNEQDSIHAVFNELINLLKTMYPDEKTTADPAILRPLSEYTPIITGKAAFDEIEAELAAFNTRSEHFVRAVNKVNKI